MRFRPGQLIRNITTGKPMLVIQSSNTAVIVVDPEDDSDPTPTKALLARELIHWVKDTDLTSKKKADNATIWTVSSFGAPPL